VSDSNASSALSAAEHALRNAKPKHDIVVLPHEFSSGEVALYDESVLDLVKALRADGIDAHFAHDVAHRSWIGRKSAELVVSFIVGIASNAGWAGICTLLRRRHGNNKIDAKIAQITQTEESVTWQWIELRGTGDEIAAIIQGQRGRQFESNGNEE
jgi:hypothetical protein